jgi:hypothetical protein
MCVEDYGVPQTLTTIKIEASARVLSKLAFNKNKLNLETK